MVYTHNCLHISGSYSVDVADGRGWEVIVDDHVDSLEVNPSTHQISTDQYPDLKKRNAIFVHIIEPLDVAHVAKYITRM